MAQDDLFERYRLVTEAQHRRAAAADGTGRELDQPGTALVVAELGMHRTFDNAQGAHRTIGAVLDRGLQRRGDRGWGDVDRLLEKWSIERVWLVEDGQDMQAPIHDEAFERDLVAGNELLDQVSGGQIGRASCRESGLILRG